MDICVLDFPALIDTMSVLAFKKLTSFIVLTWHFDAYLSAFGSSFSPGSHFRAPLFVQ